MKPLTQAGSLTYWRKLYVSWVDNHLTVPEVESLSELFAQRFLAALATVGHPF